MKKVSEIMNEMGFNKNSPESVKEAFIKHLIKASTGQNVITPTEKKIIRENPDKIISFPQQMSFDFYDEEALEVSRQKSKIKQKIK